MTSSGVEGERSAREEPRRGGAAARLNRRRSLRDELPLAGVEGLDDGLSPLWEAAISTPLPAHFRRDAIMRRTLALADMLGAYGALCFAVFAVGHGAGALRPACLLVGPAVVLTSKVIGLYDRDQNTLRKTTVDELPPILHLAAAFGLVIWLLQAPLVVGELDRTQVFTLVIASFGFIAIGRIITRSVVLALLPAERCLFLGSHDDAVLTARKLRASPGVKAELVGRVALERGERSAVEGIHMLGDASSLVDLIDRHQVHRVIVAPGSHEQDEVVEAIRGLKALGVKVSVLPRLLEVVGSSSTFDEIDGITLLGVRQYGLTKSSQIVKRSLDLAAAGFLLVLLTPFFALVALAIKLDSSGPVFFRQARIGRRGRRFEMLKFRSMVQDADRFKDRLRAHNEAEGGLFKISDDPRVTRVGRLLRAMSLDELPQLLNVLLGHMSLVGPRPLVPDEDALIEGWKRRRLALRPGLTGLWQIYGSARIPMQEMVKIDYLYGANWSIWLDLKILIRTVPYVLRRRGL